VNVYSAAFLKNLKIKIMKILINEQIEKEVEFPIPSFWKSFYGCVLITEDYYIKVSDNIIVKFDKEERLKRIAKQINPDFEEYEQIEESEFMEAYNTAIEGFSKAIQLPEIA
jgi:hypothetical protein